ncbi:MAG: DUF4131 domain-containing protein, partial [Candidatus Omnitrophica bacterium]|nr:DUF4131 domain-containing protein [Candidatus Omnitrophota bacterium]
MKRPILYVLIPFSLGIAFSRITCIPILYSILAAAAFTIASLLFARRRSISQAALFLAILFTGLALSLNANILPADHIANSIPPKGNDRIYLRGTIADDPVVTATRYGAIRTDFTLKAGLLKDGAGWRRVSGLVRVDILSRGTQSLSFGSEAILDGT